ncbi:surface carbohydrate biosynthesis protein [Alphaproteobacteria bacterium LSUCC0719]
MPRICLILDNPLRDLDGLCLIAWHLAQAGAEVFLVPMHMQGFDVPSLKPDVVLVNYVRANNLDLLKLYHQQGIRVVVLDTEGTGEWWPKHADLLQRQNVRTFVSQYYCWGAVQAQTLIEADSFAPEQVMISGCPRYDFIVDPWRKALPSNDVESGYILINTNFPVVNPQFAKGTNAEIEGWVKVGWGSHSDATAFAIASRELFENIKDVVATLARTLPEKTFVLRPHPFESLGPYETMAASLPNLLLRKEGTSLQWINQAAALLHVNCFTGVEAGLMQIEALGFEWLNRSEIRQHSGEPFRVSRNASSIDEIVQWLRFLTIESEPLPFLPNRDDALNDLVSANYHAIDGKSAKRVADALQTLAHKGPLTSSANMSPLGARQRMSYWTRRWLGYGGASLIKNLTTPAKLQRERKKKIPPLEAVNEVMERIHRVGGGARHPQVRNTLRSDYLLPYRSSYKSVRITST